MDTSTLQLFAADEILERLTHRKLTGCFKVFTPLESANVYFKKGMIIAAVKGEAQGEAALRQILDWKDALFAWEADLAVPASTLKPVLISFEAFMKKKDAPSKTSMTGISPPAVTASNGRANNPTRTKPITMTGETRSNLGAELVGKNQLTLVNLADSAQTFKLGKATSVIGRNPGCDIPIPDASISRQHCILQLTDQGLHVKDLNTVNGTRINDVPTKEGYINVGDKLTVGHLAFALEQAKE